MPKTQYRKLLISVSRNGKIDAVEMEKLASFRKQLKLSDEDHIGILKELGITCCNESNGDKEIYISASTR